METQQKMEVEMNALLKDKQKHLAKMTEIEKYISSMKGKLKSEMNKSLEYQDRCLQLESIIEKNKVQHVREVKLREEENKIQHDNVLNSIDEKVRKTLQAKDEKISALIRQLKQSETKREETEEMIRSLRDELRI